MRRLEGADLGTILEAIQAAVSPQDQDILGEIVKQALACEQSTHGFVSWARLISDGVASLPERIPTAVLLAWRGDYGKQPLPLRRCQGCKMVLPNVPEMWSAPCPVCGSALICYADLSKPLGVAWLDPRTGHNKKTYPG
jgi:predicted RNA-binding Zn-ribbon protein involved in translation (DUF1610 family)